VCSFCFPLSLLLSFPMNSQMETNPKVHPLHLSNNQLSNSNAADSSQRPNKVQKTNDHLPNQASYSINIPEFMGPIPSIQQHSMNNFSHNNATTLQQERFHEYNQFQNQQDQPSSIKDILGEIKILTISTIHQWKIKKTLFACTERSISKKE
jgi:hypothetical protein